MLFSKGKLLFPWETVNSCIHGPARIKSYNESELRSSPLLSHGLCLCLTWNFPLKRTPIYWIRAHINELILSWLHLQKPYFQIRSHWLVLMMGRISTYILGGYNSMPNGLNVPTSQQAARLVRRKKTNEKFIKNVTAYQEETP